LTIIISSGFFGSDKILHLTYSIGITGITNHIMTEEFGVDASRSQVISISLTSVIGLGKELYDLRLKKRFSLVDLVWDLAGIGLGYLLFVR